MKNLITKTLLASALLSSSFAASVVASKTGGDVTKALDSAKYSDIVLYPQTTVKSNDKTAIEKNSNAGASKAKIAAVYNDKEIAISLMWDDATENKQAQSSTSYPDGFAIQIDTTNGENLPYIGMGSEGRPVAVYLAKNSPAVFEPNGNGDVLNQLNARNHNVFEKDWKTFEESKATLAKPYHKAFISEGFRSLTEIKDGSSSYKISLTKTRTGWNGVLVRPLSDDYVKISQAVAIAVATWDGDKLGRDGIKKISSWTAIKLDANPSKIEDNTNEIAKGNAALGKTIAETNCASCHILEKGLDGAPEYMAPNLKNIGGYSTASYLKESIVNPNAVIVPGYNRNAHKNFEWYSVGDDGKRVSGMPGFDYLPANELDDLVAYLQTLKEEVK